MIKKIIGINGSPRKGWNTDQMVRECLAGAKSVGASTKLYQVSDLQVRPCNSCLMCKRADRKYEGKCVIKDDLTPILTEIKTADALVIGSPIYFGFMSGSIYPLFERMLFSNVSYNKNRGSVFGKKIKTGFIFTMNANKKFCDQLYKGLFNTVRMDMTHVFGSCEILPSYNTIQVSDYSKYDITMFDLQQKYKDRREVFPEELRQAFNLGKKLVE